MSAPLVRPMDRVRRAVDDLPDDATYEDAIERLVVLHKVQRGLDQMRSGDALLSQDDVEAHFAQHRVDREAP